MCGVVSLLRARNQGGKEELLDEKGLLWNQMHSQAACLKGECEGDDGGSRVERLCSSDIPQL